MAPRVQVLGVLLAGASLCAQAAGDELRWTDGRAWMWYEAQPWPVGFNYVPSSAVNDTEMWQAETFDPETIDRELGWAEETGYNSCRVFLQYLAWREDPEGFLDRFERFLALADAHGLTVMPIFFDDCAFAGKEPYAGKQADPVPGVHNSQWVPSPGRSTILDRAQWPSLEAYVRAIVSAHREDERVYCWDLYNEPGNSGADVQGSLALLRATAGWVRAEDPTQPLTAAPWGGEAPELTQAMLEVSDLVSFHCYADLEATKAAIEHYREQGRPLLLTEWMARGLGSRFASHLPVFQAERIGCWQWGLVQGRTQTYYPWGSPEGAPEPALWHHDLFRPDGTPFDPEEIAVIRRCTGRE
jgi:hypothetical protein